MVSLRATNYEAHNHLQVCYDVTSTLPQEVYFGHFQFCEVNVKLLLLCKNRGTKLYEVDGWSHSDRFTTSEKSCTLDRKERGPQCGVEV